MAILDQEAKYSYVNAAWTRVLGYQQDELVGLSPAEFTHPADRAEDARLVAAILSGEIDTYTREKRYVRADGSVVHALLHAAAVQDAHAGRYYVGQFQDISERVQAERAVRSLQVELAREVEISATVLRNLPRGAIFLVDRNLCYVSAAGPSVPDLVGVPAAGLPGRSAEEVIPAVYRAEALERVRATLDGQTLHFEAMRGGRMYEVRTTPIYSGEPFPVAALLHFYDITERRAQASELETERERFRALVENAPIGIFEMDVNGNVLYMNEHWRALTGLSLEEARSPWLRAAGIAAEDRDRFLAAWYEAGQTGQPFKIDFRYQAEGGTLRRLTTFATPMRGPNGRTTGFIGVTLDATVQREAADAIERSLREKETLLKEIHHRVKNNLQVIGSIIRLQASRSDDARVKAVFDDLRSRIHAIALLHERLYSSPDLAAIDLLEYLRGLVADTARTAGARADSVRVLGPDRRVSLGLDDAVPVGLIATELVTNSFKHGSRSGEKPNVELKLTLEPEHALLSVSDDGPGFADGFEPHSAKTLGMLLLGSLARQLEGELSFRGRPACGTLRFPLREKLLP